MISTIVAVVAPVVFAVVVWLTCCEGAPKAPEDLFPLVMGSLLALAIVAPFVALEFREYKKKYPAVEIQNTSPQPVYVSVPKPEYLGTITIGSISTELATGTIWTSSNGPYIYADTTWATITAECSCGK